MNSSKGAKLDLPENDIHLWFTSPKNCHDTTLLERYKDLLTAVETTKQQRYIFSKDRHDALVTRAFVRDLLSQYVDIPPEDWRFSQGDKGKPEIIEPEIPLRFNISHTQDMIICAVTLNHDVGCDVEHTERKSDVLAIADRFFSEIEIKALLQLPQQQQRERFFDYWTLKESYIKACGGGLAIPLSDFSFHIGVSESEQQNENIRLSFSDNRDDDPQRWRSWLFYPSANHHVALSVKDSSASVGSKGQHRKYRIRFFDSLPLKFYQELPTLPG